MIENEQILHWNPCGQSKILRGKLSIVIIFHACFDFQIYLNGNHFQTECRIKISHEFFRAYGTPCTHAQSHLNRLINTSAIECKKIIYSYM